MQSACRCARASAAAARSCAAAARAASSAIAKFGRRDEFGQRGLGFGAIGAGFVAARREALRGFLERRKPRRDLRLFALGLGGGFARAFDRAQGVAMRLPGLGLGRGFGSQLGLRRFGFGFQFVGGPGGRTPLRG